MKWSTLTAVFATLPLALGGVIEAQVMRRDGHGAGGHGAGHSGLVPSAPEVTQEITPEGHVVTHVVILWVNPGADASTTKLAPSSALQNAQPAHTHTVIVGGEAGLKFIPESLSASVGDTVEFVFMSQNHTVTQSTFDAPCKKMDGGLDSGFMPNPNNTVSPPPMMAMQVMDTKPLCKSLYHY